MEAKWKFTAKLHSQNYYLQVSVNHSPVAHGLLSKLQMHGWKGHLTQGKSSRWPPQIEKLTQGPMVKVNKTTCGTWHLKVIPFLPGRWGSPFPCETFCWACLERFSLQLKLRAFPVTAGFHLCPICGWMVLCLAAGPWGTWVLTLIPKLGPQTFCKWDRAH